jgi:hypothetical protein
MYLPEIPRFERMNARRMLDAPRCPDLVNVRDHASQLYEELLRAAEEKGLDQEGILHLSTRVTMVVQRKPDH